VENLAPTPWSVEIASCAGSFAEGDVSALGRLFDLAAPRLVRYAETLTRAREDAEDAVQAAIVRIARNPQSLAAVRFPWAYLLRTVRNEALRLISRKRPAASLAVEQTGDGVLPDRLADAETTAAVQAAIARLPAEQAEVIALKIWEELTFQEIATVTGESLNTVASRYRYALSKLEMSLRRVAWEVGYVVE
jgi:RNA polymerase sigma-70 factor (ECF subfamily)